MDIFLLFLAASHRKDVLRRSWVLVSPRGEVREVVHTSREGSVARSMLEGVVEGLCSVPAGERVAVCVHDQVLVDLGREHVHRWRAHGWRRGRKKLDHVDLLESLVRCMEEREVYWERVPRTHPTLARARQLCRMELPRVQAVPLSAFERLPPVVEAPPTRLLAYTDGACADNPGGPGGWAFLLVDTATGHALERAGGEAHTTNNRMELMAAIRALESLRGEDRKLVVRSDSRYLIDLCTRWLPGWRRQGWRRPSGEPVRNLDLVHRLDALMQRHRVHWEWVRAHAGEPGNEHVDALATSAQERIREGEDGAWERRYEQSPLRVGG